MFRARLVAACLATFSVPLFAQSGDRCEGAGSAVVDDGTYEEGGQCTGLDCYFVQKLTPSSYPSLLTKACICWMSIGAPSHNYDLVVFDDNGSGGTPGTRLDSKGVSVTGVNLSGKYIGHACADLGITVTSGGVYVGPNWSTFALDPGDDFYICSDESVSTPEADAFLSTSGTFWTDITTISSTNALGIRGEFQSLAGSCIPSDTTLCLDSGRFRVTVNWRDFQGGTGVGHGQALTDLSGTFWFFGPDNIEFLVKVVDGCGLNNRYWVFAAATTNVEYDMIVEDMHGGVSKPYHNDLGVASPAITDTSAFATCP